MMLIVGLVLTIGTVMVSISALRALPLFIRKIVVNNELLAFGFNFAISSLITMFIGSGMIAGAGNLLGSIIFAIYVTADKKRLLKAGK